MEFLKIDIHTIIIMLFLGNFLAVLVLISYKSGKSREGAYREFMLGKLLQGFAWLLLGLRGDIPDLFSVIAGNSFIIAGTSLEALALITVSGRSRVWETIYTVISLAGIILFTFFSSAAVNIRVGVASLITLIIYFPASVELIRTGKKSRLRSIVGFMCGLLTLFLLFRAWYGFFSPGEFALLTPGVVQTLSFLQIYFFMLVAGIGFLLMLKEQNDRKLSESEERYRTLVEGANEGIVIIKQRRFIFANQRMLSILGVTEEELMKRDVDDFLHPDDRVWVMDNYKRRIHGEDVAGKYDLRLMSKGGETIWVTMSASMINIGDGPAIMSLLTDITDRKTLETEREKNIEELHKALGEVKTLGGLLPICSSCKKIRDDRGYWNQIEVYIRDHSEADFSHSLCPDCVDKLYPGLKKGGGPIDADG